MTIRQFAIFALVLFAIVGMAFAADDESPSKGDSASTPAGEAGAAKGDSAATPAASDEAGATDMSPSEGPSSDGSSFKASIVGAFVNAMVVTMRNTISSNKKAIRFLINNLLRSIAATKRPQRTVYTLFSEEFWCCKNPIPFVVVFFSLLTRELIGRNTKPRAHQDVEHRERLDQWHQYALPSLLMLYRVLIRRSHWMFLIFYMG
ncbi:unnamed protein product [Lactuca virosa]|uniref:Uncharacterized protein n=1 Tax=Lactuca virosa TaxID=75947 RepID=A0AAU9LKH8_9ASTR|nr:unnamed protein product [Lactuca virosa]